MGDSIKAKRRRLFRLLMHDQLDRLLDFQNIAVREVYSTPGATPHGSETQTIINSLGKDETTPGKDGRRLVR